MTDVQESLFPNIVRPHDPVAIDAEIAAKAVHIGEKTIPYDYNAKLRAKPDFRVGPGKVAVIEADPAELVGPAAARAALNTSSHTR